MNIKGMQVIGEGSGTSGYTVEFIDEADIVTSITFPKSQTDVNRTNAIQQAKRYLQRLVEGDVLPDAMEDGENQDGRAATMASSPQSPKHRADSSE